METKKCKCCGKELDLSLFHKDSSRKDGHENSCKTCTKERNHTWVKNNPGLSQARSRMKEIKRMKGKKVPDWLSDSDLLAIKCYYQVAAMRNRNSDIKWSVDHIIPLNGKTVSGLHVPSNLQVIPLADNLSKRNKYEPA